MFSNPIRCLILACGNPLRRDDGVGAWLASWAQAQFKDDATTRVMYRQQWTPELAEDVSHAESVIFIDASGRASPGTMEVRHVEPTADLTGFATHHLSASELLAYAAEMYETSPRTALMMTIGVGSAAFGETFSDPVQAMLPEACAKLEALVRGPQELDSNSSSKTT